MVREPLAGQRARVPVHPDTAVALSSPGNTVAGLLRAAEAGQAEWGARTAVNLPALTVTVRDMAAALKRIAGPAATALLDWDIDPAIAAIVGNWPSRVLSRASRGAGPARRPALRRSDSQLRPGEPRGGEAGLEPGAGMREILLGCIADDFTGATDLANNLVRAGMRVVQAIGVPAQPLDVEADAVVVALKSRTTPAAEAVEQSLAALAWLRGAGARQIYFKYCSTFDSTEHGNIGPVADALMDALGAAFSIACPAFPANRRTLYLGHLFVGEELLSDSPMRHHPLTPMTDANLVRVFGRQTRRRVGLVALSRRTTAVAAGEPCRSGLKIAQLRADGCRHRHPRRGRAAATLQRLGSCTRSSTPLDHWRSSGVASGLASATAAGPSHCQSPTAAGRVGGAKAGRLGWQLLSPPPTGAGGRPCLGSWPERRHRRPRATAEWPPASSTVLAQALACARTDWLHAPARARSASAAPGEAGTAVQGRLRSRSRSAAAGRARPLPGDRARAWLELRRAATRGGRQARPPGACRAVQLAEELGFQALADRRRR